MSRASAAKKGRRAPEYAVPALDRGLEILETLSASPMPLSLTDLARSLQHAPSGLFRLLARLEKRRYVVREPVSGKYSLTLRLYELSHTHSPVESLLRAAGGPMRDLAAEVEESVHLSVLTHEKLVVLLDVGSPSKVRISIEAGSQFSAVTTTSGRLLLAHLSPDELERFLSHDQEYLGLSRSARTVFRAELLEVRERGYAIAPSQERTGLTDIAVLVGNPAIGQSAALAIACWRAGMTDEPLRLVKPLQACAARITEAQGLNYDHSPKF